MKSVELSVQDVSDFLSTKLPHGYFCPVCKIEQFPTYYQVSEDDPSIAFTTMDFFLKAEDRSIIKDSNTLVIPFVCENCGYMTHYSASIIAKFINEKRGAQ